MKRRSTLTIMIMDDRGKVRMLRLHGWKLLLFKLGVLLSIMLFVSSLIYLAFMGYITKELVSTKMENLRMKEKLSEVASVKSEIEEFMEVKQQLYELLGLNITADGNYETYTASVSILPSDTPHGLPASGIIVRKHTNKHKGIDMALKESTPVLATANGVVVKVDSNSRFGLHVVVQHSRGYSTLYAHLSRINVKPGMKVKKGQIIGFSGSTGESTGPHLHYEVWKNGKSIDPLRFR